MHGGRKYGMMDYSNAMQCIRKERMNMYITCLDVEGVLVPEIWVAFAEASGIPELKKTTREEPDYDKLMKWRLDILKEHGLGLKEIQKTIETIDPLPVSYTHLFWMRRQRRVSGRTIIWRICSRIFPIRSRRRWRGSL